MSFCRPVDGRWLAPALEGRRCGGCARRRGQQRFDRLLFQVRLGVVRISMCGWVIDASGEASDDGDRSSRPHTLNVICWPLYKPGKVGGLWSGSDKTENHKTPRVQSDPWKQQQQQSEPQTGLRGELWGGGHGLWCGRRGRGRASRVEGRDREVTRFDASDKLLDKETSDEEHSPKAPTEKERSSVPERLRPLDVQTIGASKMFSDPLDSTSLHWLDGTQAGVQSR
ncbi:hypothetical protein BDK51DRAFT_37580 [Blyttiomyces helicus]|uniref:Uncharacterized protein n=1 Tax=Blyttiomyces helicus TaxID=388810 RepID=A0A4P9W5C4_9FUNG|nr:hypothetical protein BDK51DRAFT_37580 [Blyttiomyces helicus]|eukprot:RKO87152.1 hypothetical protein BDK51DRAFT_37580 [Blyttiomyces helicus]